MLFRSAAAGYWASLTPEYLCFPRDQRLADCFPLDQLLLETDGPEPLRIGREGIPSPLWSRDTAAALAARLSREPLELEREMDQNACRFFGLPL